MFFRISRKSLPALAGTLLFAGLGLALAGCHQEAAAKPAPPKPPEVVVCYPVEDTVTDYEDFTGRLMPINVVEIRSRVTGYLDKVLFKDGDDVKAGQSLFEIDPRWYAAELEQRRTAVTQARARRDRTVRAEERAKTLLQTRSMSQEDYDTARFDKLEAEAALASAEANFKLAELNLSYTNITARFDGRISRRLVDPGNMVKADDTPLATLVALNPIYAYFDLDERTLLHLKRLVDSGQIESARKKTTKVTFALADETEFTHEGTIDFVDPQVEGTTGTLRLRAVVNNDKGMFAPGMFVRLRVPIGAPRKALMVQEEALGSDQGQRFVYVVNDKDEVNYRRVETGLLNNGKRVIEKGLDVGERVIVTGLQRVRPGVKVTPTMQKETSNVAETAAPKPVAVSH